MADILEGKSIIITGAPLILGNCDAERGAALEKELVSHMMMEPHATITAWDGDRLTVWTSVQTVDWGRRDLSKDPWHA